MGIKADLVGRTNLTNFMQASAEPEQVRHCARLRKSLLAFSAALSITRTCVPEMLNKRARSQICLRSGRFAKRPYLIRGPLFLFCGPLIRRKRSVSFVLLGAFFSFDVKLISEAQAEAVEAICGPDEVAISNAAVQSVAVPAAATAYAVRACRRPGRVGLRGG